jgi:hypothetical protein
VLAERRVGRNDEVALHPAVLAKRRNDLQHADRALRHRQGLLANDLDFVAAGETPTGIAMVVRQRAADAHNGLAGTSLLIGGRVHDSAVSLALDERGFDPADAARRRCDHEPSARIMAMDDHLHAAIELARRVVILPGAAAGRDIVSGHDSFVGELHLGGANRRGRHNNQAGEEERSQHENLQPGVLTRPKQARRGVAAARSGNLRENRPGFRESGRKHSRRCRRNLPARFSEGAA